MGLFLVSLVLHAWSLTGSAPAPVLGSGLSGPAGSHRSAPKGELIQAFTLPSGIALPYPTRRVFRGFGPCLKSGAHFHEAIDLGGVGPDGGLGTAVRSLARARITRLGKAEVDPVKFGAPDTRPGPALRDGRELPRVADVPGYGAVAFFSREQGTWRSGNLVETEVIGGPLDGARVRYLHLGAVRPDLRVGDVLEPGEELGLLGGTGVMESSPHLHIDARDADDVAIDLGPWLGLAPTASCGEVAKRASEAASAIAAPSGPDDATWPAWHPRRWGAPVGAPEGLAKARRRRPARVPAAVDLAAAPSPYLGALAPTRAPVVPTGKVLERALSVPDCGKSVIDDDFRSGQNAAHTFRAHLAKGRYLEVGLSAVPVGAEAAWTPTLELFDATTGLALTREQPGPLTLGTIDGTSGAPPRLRVVVGAAVDVIVAIRGPVDASAASASAYRLQLAEKCKPKGAAPH
ncbi:MAG: hypothetical protein U1F43_35105 [Myxococcota bacterium]